MALDGLLAQDIFCVLLQVATGWNEKHEEMFEDNSRCYMSLLT